MAGNVTSSSQSGIVMATGAKRSGEIRGFFFGVSRLNSHHLLRPDDGSVQHAVIATIFKVFCVGIARSRLLVDIDAETRLVIGINVALADLWRTRKYLT